MIEHEFIYSKQNLLAVGYDRVPADDQKPYNFILS